MKRLPNRWVIALAAVVMQLCLGAVYSWSVFVKPLTASEPWTLVQVSATFTIAMMCLGMGTVIGGLWQDRKGPRVVTTAAGLLYGLGFLISSWAVANHQLWGMYFGFGLVSGIGMGMGYICPVAVITKWFPDKRGLMTGAAVMGFGAGAVIASPVAAKLIISGGVSYTFEIFGIVYLLLIVAAAQFHQNPPVGWKPEGWVPRSAVAKAATQVDFTVKEALRTRRFYLLWLLLSLNTSAGIMIVSQASPLAQQQAHLTVVQASALVGIIAIFNATGRVFWAWISDMIGRAQTFFLLFAIQVPLFFLLAGVHEMVLFQVMICGIAFCYGGGYGVTPSFTADFFGSKNLGGIYGWILLGWGFALVPSPILIAHIRQSTGTYEYAIYTIGFVMLIALIVPLLAKREVTKQASARELQRA